MDTSIDTVAAEKLNKAVADALKHLELIFDTLPFLTSLTSERRQHSGGKLKNGEETAIEAVLSTVQHHPAPFASLKVDPKAIRELLSRRVLLQPLAERAHRLAEDLADTVLRLGETVKEPSSAAYHVATALARHDPAIAHDIQPAQQFYQSVGRAAARTRKAHRTDPAS